jgi:hypothetical protein
MGMSKNFGRDSKVMFIKLIEISKTDPDQGMIQKDSKRSRPDQGANIHGGQVLRLNESIRSHKYVWVYGKDEDEVKQDHRYSYFSVFAGAEDEEDREAENLSDQSASASAKEIPGDTEKGTEKVEYPFGLVLLRESQREA